MFCDHSFLQLGLSSSLSTIFQVKAGRQRQHIWFFSFLLLSLPACCVCACSFQICTCWALTSTDPPALVLPLSCCLFLAQVQLFLFQLCLLSPPLPDSSSVSRPAMACHTPPFSGFAVAWFLSSACLWALLFSQVWLWLPPAILRLPLSP